MQKIIRYNNRAIELHVEQREDKLLVLNVDSGVWKIYNVPDEKLTFLELYISSETFVEMISKDGLLEGEVELEPIPDTDKFTLLILEVTDACNMGCTYCFEGKKEKCNIKMSEDIAIKAFDFFTELDCSDEIMVEFNGGESLLNFELIKAVVPQLLNKAEEKGVHIIFTLQTNGTLLSEEIVDFLKEYNISVGISVDGKAKYNNNRKFKNGELVDEVLCEKFAMLKKMKKDFCTLSVVSQPNQYIDIVELENEIGNVECRINLMNDVGNGSDMTLEKSDLSRIADDFIKFSKNALFEKKIYEANLSCYLMGMFLYNPFMCYKTPCGSGKNQIYIKADGSVYACQESCYINKGLIGHVDEKVDVLKDRISKDEWINSTSCYKSRGKCCCCPWKKICHVCPAAIEQGEGMCEFNRLIIPELFWIIAENEERILEYLQYK